jgi:hypothetical protein
MSQPNYITLFVDATINAGFFYYGEWKQQDIKVNGLIKIDESDLFELNNKLIKDYGDVTFRGHSYKLDEVQYNVDYRSINRVI